MAKFCSKCGNKLDDNAVFCNMCGAAQGQQAAQPVNIGNIPQTEGAAAVKGSSGKTIGIIIAVAAVVVVAVVLLLIFGLKDNYTEPLDNFVKVYNDGDVKAMKTFVAPYNDDVRDVLGLDDKADIDVEQYAEQANEGFKEYFGDNVKMSYTVTDEEKIDKADLDDYSPLKDYEDDLSEEELDEYKLTKAYKLWITYKVKSDTTDEKDTTTVVVGKINGNWYLIDGGTFGDMLL